VPYAAAIEAATAFGTCAGWDATIEALEGERFRDDGTIDVPVTLAWGEHDVVIGKRCRMPTEIPAHARVVTMPSWGHVPTYDDPGGIARLLLEG
jgi:pimeloyl-ACP methyl ester carboxylesterase